MFDIVREDLGRYGRTPGERLRAVLLTPGAWAVLIYRFRRWEQRTRLPGPLGWPTKVLSLLAQWWAEVATNIQLPLSAEIGPGLLIPHTGYVVLSTRAKIGRNCTLTQGVTIGHARGGSANRQGVPVLGDRVYVGPGAAVIGPITVGDDALVGVGAVVLRSVPPRGVAVGNPARVISRRGSFDLIDYPGKYDDSGRSSVADEGHEGARTEHSDPEAPAPRYHDAAEDAPREHAYEH